ncbi:MAG: 4Fe-4S binding protein [Candidatus Bathyarchaeota archaeon]|nr:4Fe-4S binding protein [Candidatus Bathyarchaeota archaeon]
MSQKRAWQDLPKGAVSYKSSMDYKTGDWGVNAPKIDYDKCIKCNLCHFFCPEGAISVRDDETPEVSLDYCKGCGICAKECPVQCMEMVRK